VPETEQGINKLIFHEELAIGQFARRETDFKRKGVRCKQPFAENVAQPIGREYTYPYCPQRVRSNGVLRLPGIKRKKKKKKKGYMT
jgi:hypothetical protein